jgi:hypothetical protein
MILYHGLPHSNAHFLWPVTLHHEDTEDTEKNNQNVLRVSVVSLWLRLLRQGLFRASLRNKPVSEDREDRDRLGQFPPHAAPSFSVAIVIQGIHLSGENDPNCPLPGARIAFSAAEAAYKQAGALDRLKIDIAAGVGHRVTEEQRLMAIAWFERWLKN